MCFFLPLAILAIFFSALGFYYIKKDKNYGKGMVIAGLIIGIADISLILFSILD